MKTRLLGSKSLKTLIIQSRRFPARENVPIRATSNASLPKPEPGTNTRSFPLQSFNWNTRFLNGVDRPFVTRYIGEMSLQSILHRFIACISLLFSLCKQRSYPIGWVKWYRFHTSSLQSRTNCFSVLRSLSISKSVGL